MRREPQVPGTALLAFHGKGAMKKTLAALLMLAAAAMALLFAKELFHAATPVSGPHAAEEVEEGFRVAVARLRPTLPKKIDAATTLRDVSSARMVLTYHYVVDSDNYDLQPNFMQTAQRVTTTLVCNTQEMRSAMRVGGVYEYKYSDRNAKALGGFVVTSADCG
jgi:hypothetical protein